jgi:hypothetical protein
MTTWTWSGWWSEILDGGLRSGILDGGLRSGLDLALDDDPSFVCHPDLDPDIHPGIQPQRGVPGFHPILTSTLP